MTLLSRPRAAWALASYLYITGAVCAAEATPKPAAEVKVSYSKQVVAILQANCIGCHQPAKAQGGYILTSYAALVTAGDSGKAPVVVGKPDASELIAQVVIKDGKHLMPKSKPALNADDVATLSHWISQGAVNDDSSASISFDADHPPTYPVPPAVTSLDASPDGSLIAVAGYHEVLLHKADGSGLAGRLVGLSERIESVRFSPDGKSLSVAAGDPCRRGEIQIWDVSKRKLKSSISVGYDTVRGISWSPDGRFVAVACPDNNVRAFDVSNGQQTLAQGSHSDWPLDTVFSVDGSHIVSVGRDRTTKLTEVATQRFVDNITSITPGALKGGIAAIARHPQRDEIVVGGSDGQPKVYRIHRLTKRVIGDDSNLIRELPAMFGRVNGLAISRDGTRIVAGSGLDRAGEVAIYGYEFKTDLPGPIKTIMEKVASSRNAEEKAQLAAYHSEGVKQIASVKLPAVIYAVTILPDGSKFAAAGSDGVVRLFETATGKPAGQFSAAPVTPATGNTKLAATGTPKWLEEMPATELLPSGAKVASLDVQPKQIAIAGPFAYAQLLVTATLDTGERIDATRMVAFDLPSDAAIINRAGLVRPLRDGSATLAVSLGGVRISVPVAVGGLATDPHVDYIRDVMPVTSRMGCNQGTCHGSAQGKNGFKLSLRGYDPIFDVRAFTDEHAGRRVNLAAADRSLMVLKASGAVPHVGGQLTRPGEPYYETLKAWIAGGATLDQNTPRVKSIDVEPKNPIVPSIEGKQQLRVVATYADGSQRDVTHEAFLDSGNTDVATSSRTGLMTALRRGEAPILARFEGAYAATTLTVMGDRSGFAWEQPPAFNRIDDLAAAKWQRMKIRPSDVCTDDEFLRRVSLDLTGLPPSADQVRAFLADATPSREKREKLVDTLVGSKEYIDHWTNKWADLLQVNRKFLGTEGASAFRQWIRAEVAANTPYDQFARKVLTATGSNKDNPAAAYFKILREPTALMENTTHLFLAVRFNCNKCHDHPFERWTQDQYYQTSAYFAQVGLQPDTAASNGKMIGGTAVEGGKPLYEKVADLPKGEVLHDRTKDVTPPVFPFACDHQCPGDAPRREHLASWLTSKDNPLFARSYANRLWGYLFGVGIIEPIDDIRAGNPASNPELLDFLTKELVASGFDSRHVVKLICKSRTYQLSVVTNKWNKDDKTNYSHATARRLPAEVLYDSIYKVAGAVSKIPGVPAGTRAAELPDAGVELPSGFLGTLGRPVRESACECERTTGLQLGPVMALVNGPIIAEALADPANELSKLVAAQPDDRKLVDELFLRVLNRSATPAEIDASVALIGSIEREHARLSASREARAVEVAPLREKAEHDRSIALGKAELELGRYEREIAPKLKQLADEQKARIAGVEKALAAAQAKLGDKVPMLEQEARGLPHWSPLMPQNVKSSAAGSKLLVEADRSIFASGKSAKTTYTITAATELKQITGFRLEALADDRLPMRGPGRSANGNFVLNQFDVKIAPKTTPKQQSKVDLRSATADFSQEQFGPKGLIDGSSNGTKGWAVMGATGLTHWVIFEAKTPFGFDEGTILTISLPQQYDASHELGRFRIGVTTATGKLPLGVPEPVLAALGTAAEERSSTQKETILAHLRVSDSETKKLAQELAEAKKPLPPDPKLVELQAILAEAKKPVPEDPKLTQLTADTAASKQQLADRRLTAAQDIVWALMNSPAFLFNR